MIPLCPLRACSPEQPRVSRPRLSTLVDEVARLDPRLAPDSTRFRSAVLLLAARELGQNVDRLARFTRYPREMVARCARRLVDNGVWKQGETVSRWAADPREDPEAFWGDVGVAEGKLYRRLGGGSTIEWVPVGEWWKSYERVEQPVDLGEGLSQRATWDPAPVAAPAEDPPEPAPAPRPDREARERAPEHPAGPPRRPPAPAPPLWIGAPLGPLGGIAYLGTPELVRGAVWLS